MLKVLGEGGFGTVYLAHDDELSRPVAIKVPRRCQVSRPEDVEMYMAEARVVARLDHPGIVPVYDVGRTDDGLYY
ncbi:MAG: protein kinase [Planctomycetota bacterium]